LAAYSSLKYQIEKRRNNGWNIRQKDDLSLLGSPHIFSFETLLIETARFLHIVSTVLARRHRAAKCALEEGLAALADLQKTICKFKKQDLAK